ncbi:MAG: hypothetical protein ACYTGB_09230 [Planctomycetota bacterium]
MAKSAFGTAFLILLAAGSARADGIPFKGNRVASPATVIVLDPIQRIAALRRGKVTLTPAQRVLLAARAGIAPPEIEVWSLKEAQNTCGCELGNMGIAFAPGRLEIPHAYLYTEEAAAPGLDLGPEAGTLWSAACVTVLGVASLAALRRRRRARAARSGR